MKDLPEQDYYLALGSNQKVYVKKRFQTKAKKAYNHCIEALDAEESASAHKKWKKVYGVHFPKKAETTTESKSVEKSFRQSEEFIEDRFPVDIRYSLKLECEVTQNGFRPDLLTNILRKSLRLQPKKTLLFYISSIDIPEPYDIFWKVLNRGPEAEKRDCVRGQIIEDKGQRRQKETTDFKGSHLVECYAIKNGIVVARGHIEVPIEKNKEEI